MAAATARHPSRIASRHVGRSAWPWNRR
jgi:hypothetical protein